jgi:hypothetical protein
MSLNFHDAYGRVDLSLLTPEAIAAANLTDAQTADLAIVVESVEARQSAQARLQLAKDRTRECQRLECDALAAHQAANPPPSRIDALRENIAAFNGTKLPEKPKTSHPKTAHAGPRAAYMKAQLDLAEAQEELQASMNHARACDKAEGIAMATLLKVMRPPSHEDIVREIIARETAAKLANVAAGLAPDGTPKADTLGNTPIEQAFAARRKSGFSRRRQVHRPMHPPLFKV